MSYHKIVFLSVFVVIGLLSLCWYSFMRVFALSQKPDKTVSEKLLTNTFEAVGEYVPKWFDVINIQIEGRTAVVSWHYDGVVYWTRVPACRVNAIGEIKKGGDK